MYSLLRLTGREPDYRDLVKPEYYGRLQGSSLAELNQAAYDYGLQAGTAARLSTRALRQSRYKAILHVKADAEAKDYDHYTLYLGTENGKARVFSPPEEPKLVDFAELASLWDGYGLFVSEQPFDIDTLFQPDRQRLYFFGMSAVLLLLIGHAARRLWLFLTPALSRRMTLGLTVGQTATLALIALLAGGFYHYANDEGLLANTVGTMGVQRAHAGGFIPKISERRVRKLLGRDIVLIDARLTPDYERGHIEGAISLPVDANDATWEATIPTIPRGRPIVTYCQSAGCKFAEKVSLKLMDDGFDDIVIFKGGWVEWEKKHGRPKEPGKETRQDADHTV
jgi:rhodanese-related sulfurtransferase